MITGEQVLAYRKEHKLSRHAFGDQCGLSPAAIANIESGRKFKAGEEEKLISVMGESPNAHSDSLSVPITSTASQTTTVSVSPSYRVMISSWVEANASKPDVVFTIDDEDDDEDFAVVTDAEAIVVPFPTQPVDEEFKSEESTTTADSFQFPVGHLISNSETASWKRCQRQWWLAWHRHLRRKQRKLTGALAIGTWTHAALATYYVPDGHVRQDPRESLERIVQGVYTELSSQLQNLGEQGEFIDETLLTNFQKDADLARAMIEGYMQWVQETGADEGLRIIAPEQIIYAELVPGTFLIGKIDVQVQRITDNAVLFLDHKTVGDLNRPVKTIHMNPQMLRYDLIEHMQPGEPRVDGALYNMLKKVKRTERATPPFYQRVEVRHNAHEIEAHRRQTLGTVQKMRQAEEALNVSTDNHHSIVPPTVMDDCAYSCQFADVCPMFDDGSRAEDYIAQYFEEVAHLEYYDVVNTEKA